MTKEEKHKLCKSGDVEMLLVEFIDVVAKNLELYRAETEKGVTIFGPFMGNI